MAVFPAAGHPKYAGCAFVLAMEWLGNFERNPETGRMERSQPESPAEATPSLVASSA